MVGEVAGEEVVGAPPEEEEGAKEKCGGKTMVNTPYAVGSSLLRQYITVAGDRTSQQESQTIFLTQSIGPLYNLLVLSAAY